MTTPTAHHQTQLESRAFLWLALCLAAVFSAGCMGVMRVDNQVKSYAKWASDALPSKNASYCFERLPSQSNGPQASAQSELEDMVARVLARSGWHADCTDAAVRWQVQVAARTIKLQRAPWEQHPFDGFWLRGHSEGGKRGLTGFSGVWMIEAPYFQRTVSVVVRDTRTVAYESTSEHDGRWNDSTGLWQAMVDAALDGFPSPPAAVRQVNIDIPR